MLKIKLPPRISWGAVVKVWRIFIGRETLDQRIKYAASAELKRYANRKSKMLVRIFVSENLIGDDIDRDIWAEEQQEFIRKWGITWAEDNSVSICITWDVIVLDTALDFVQAQTIESSRIPTATMSRVEAESDPGLVQRAQCEAVVEFIGEKRLPLRIRSEIVLGRSAAPGIVALDDLRASRRHARIYLRGQEVFVADLDSRNGTLVNGIRIDEGSDQHLKPGDTVEMGSTRLRLVSVDPVASL